MVYKGEVWSKIPELVSDWGKRNVTRVFAGTFSHSLDGKGRVIIPAGFRDLLGSGFTIALNSSIDALALYPQEKWDAVNEQLARVRQRLFERESTVNQRVTRTFEIVDRAMMIESTLQTRMAPGMAASLNFSRALSAQGLRP